MTVNEQSFYGINEIFRDSRLSMNRDIFSKKIIPWYDENHRDLPWRKTRDAYKIWLSEIILQQTRVAQGLPYYESFVKKFPTIFELAKASEKEVLRLWQGLGYYTRARNLHRCAKEIVKNFAGEFPDSYNQLIKLPGIGPYTAAAIASIAFKEPVAVVDGNVFRVLARVFGAETDIASEEGKKHFSLLANSLIDKNQPDVFNQALMEFGALYCVPKNPKCDDCIFSSSCLAKQKNLQDFLPVKSKKVKVRTRYLNYFILKSAGKIYMRERNGKDIWKGLYDFYLIETSRNQKAKALLENDRILTKSKIINESKIFSHVLSHQKLKAKFIEIEMTLSKTTQSELKNLRMKKFGKKEIENLPKPILIERYLNGNR